MKKLLTLLAALCLAANAYAGWGITGGVTSAHTDLYEAYHDIENVSMYHLGLTYRLKLLNIAAIQPSLVYNIMNETDEMKAAGVDPGDGTLELPVMVQLGFGIPLLRVYGFLEPSVEYDFSDNLYYGLGMGFGADIAKKLQLTIRYCRKSEDTDTVLKGRPQAMKASIAIFF